MRKKYRSANTKDKGSLHILLRHLADSAEADDKYAIFRSKRTGVCQHLK